MPPPFDPAGPPPPGLEPGFRGFSNRFLMAPMENCVTKSIVSGVLGGAMGAMFGILFSGSGDLSHIPVPDKDGNYAPTQKYSWRKHAKDTWKSAKWYGKSFGVVGTIFAGSECVIEKARGRSDIYNGLGGGCFSGAALAYKGGPHSMVMGCAGFAAFSLVIDSVMGH